LNPVKLVRSEWSDGKFGRSEQSLVKLGSNE